MNSTDHLLSLFESAGAIRRGHFELSSGLHSGLYVQCALVLQHPRHAERLGAALAARFASHRIEAVVSPALGGLIIGQEVARALPAPGGAAGGCQAMFVERDAAGAMTLRRGFSLSSGQRVLVAEDVWTTGKSTQEAMRVVQESGGLVVAAGALIDRSSGRMNFSVPAEALISLPVESYLPESCPLCKQGTPAVKTGSRFIRIAG